MNNTDFTICKANQEQRDYVFERVKIKDDDERNNAIVYVATDSDNQIIGRIVIKEKDVPSSIPGKYWYISNLFVHPEFRRKGIAAALVTEIKKQAEISKIVYLFGSSNPSVEASMFWLNQGFTMNAYGKRQEDNNKPLFFGNYSHMFSYCIRRKSLIADHTINNIKRASTDDIQQVIDKYASTDQRKEFFMNKLKDLFGFLAIGDDGDIQGVIVAYPDSMQPPLDGTRLWINAFVEPECRNHGIGQSLVYEIYRYAKENGIIQLTNTDGAGDDIGFWYEIGFDIFFWDMNSKTGKRATTAMIRVK